MNVDLDKDELQVLLSEVVAGIATMQHDSRHRRDVKKLRIIKVKLTAAIEIANLKGE